MPLVRRLFSLFTPPAAPAADEVRSFELFKVAPRWLLLRMVTANGVVGWGEPNLEGMSDTVAACVAELMPTVLGADPSRIQRLQQQLRQQRFYGAAGPVIQSAVAGKVPPTSAPFSTSKRAPHPRPPCRYRPGAMGHQGQDVGGPRF